MARQRSGDSVGLYPEMSRKSNNAMGPAAVQSAAGVESVVNQQLTRLSQAIADNRKMIEELGARLSCVIPNLPEDCGGIPDKPECLVSPLASDIRMLGSRVEDGNAMLGGLLRRMEI